ncbi:MAG: HAMP domain-containing sensor histidine kinase, partial [Bdellovibrionota bacterium]
FDTGSGVPLEVRDRLFEPLFTTKPPGKATGVGLSAAKELVEIHGGKIRLVPESPETCFEVRLPFA